MEECSADMLAFLSADPDIQAWVEFGVAHGFISYPDCMFHGATDPLARTAVEEEYEEQGGDPCIVVSRYWFDN